MKTRSKVLLTAAVAIPLVLGGAGTAYAAHFQDRALPGSSLGGAPVAGMTRDQVAAAVRDRAADVTVTIDTGSGTSTAALADLGYAVDVDATVDAVFEANRTWSSYATSLVAPRGVDAVVVTDPAKTAAVVTDLVGRADKAGRDAGVKLAADKKSFTVTPAVSGQTVAPESFQDVVAVAARELSSATATVRFVDAVPVVTTSAAQQVADQANALVARKVSVSDGEDEHAASAKVKASWVTIPSTDGVLGSPTLKAAKVQAWVDGLAKDAKVTPRAGVRNVSESGKVLVVVTKARDGATVSNGPAVARAAAAAVTTGSDYQGSFTYDKTPAKWTERRVAPGAENLAYPATTGEKWIDVNLSRHTMTAYIGAKVVYGPIKMVNGSDQKPTAVGTFRVYHKRELQTMRGSNADGTRYETPDVPYISYFHRGYALHGAPWRSSFGYAGSRGSHGCVNLPVSVAKWVYDFAPIGTTVVSHH
ncbi:MAG TPA: L,D-transpeptidase family protein [Ornithinibacter sp.]|nr:L,D-transpeptidase family protein [Ornithinibacter sp.]